MLERWLSALQTLPSSAISILLVFFDLGRCHTCCVFELVMGNESFPGSSTVRKPFQKRFQGRQRSRDGVVWKRREEQGERVASAA